MTNLAALGLVASVVVLQQPQVRTEAQPPPQVRREAHQSPRDERSAGRTASRDSRHDPWGALFVAEVIARSAQQQPKLDRISPRALEQSPSPRPLIAERGPCNMPIVRANPDVDPKMVIPHRTEGVDAKIRVIEPAICGTKR